MRILTLTSDAGLNSHYIGAIKGAVLSASDMQLLPVDINHQIPAFDIVRAAYTVKNFFTHYPKNSIHVVSVNDFYGGKPSMLLVKDKGHYFILPDNGIVTLIFEVLPTQIRRYELNMKGRSPLITCIKGIVEDLFSDKTWSKHGKSARSVNQGLSFQPVIDSDRIRGTVIFIDNYGNVVVNVHKLLFESVFEGKEVVIYFKQNDPIKGLSLSYNDVGIGEPLCHFNSSNLLELSVNMGSASTLLGLNIDDLIQIELAVVKEKV
jgi:hypothetical protein